MSFSIAIPFLAFHIFFTQTMAKSKIQISAYLVKILEAAFLIGSYFTFFGTSITIVHSSVIAGIVFQASCVFLGFIAAFIYRDRAKAVKREKLEAEQKEKQLEAEKLESEPRNLQLERDTALNP